jgi:hypothetical protein
MKYDGSTLVVWVKEKGSVNRIKGRWCSHHTNSPTISKRTFYYTPSPSRPQLSRSLSPNLSVTPPRLAYLTLQDTWRSHTSHRKSYYKEKCGGPGRESNPGLPLFGQRLSPLSYPATLYVTFNFNYNVIGKGKHLQSHTKTRRTIWFTKIFSSTEFVDSTGGRFK